MEFSFRATIASIFSQAGLQKNEAEGRWEFVSASSKDATSSRDAEKTLNSIVETEKASPNEQSHTEGSSEVEKAAKKKKHRKKHRTASKDLGKDAKSDRHIRWGNVDEILFERTVSYDGIPTNGAYPLGLGSFVEICTSSVDELFSRRQYLEILAANQPPTAHSSGHNVAPSPSSNQGKKSKGGKSKGNQRKDSFDHHNDQKGHSNNTNHDSSSQSLSDPGNMTADEIKNLLDAHPMPEGDRIRKLNSPNHTTEDNDYLVTPALLDAINQEILSIRDSRDHIGCSCKPMKFDKMNVPKLKSELQHFAAQLPPNAGPVEKMKKADLIAHLREMTKDCKLCADQGCECVRLEIPCSFYGCDCLKGTPTDCLNDFGRDYFDLDFIDVQRKRAIADWKVREAGESSESNKKEEATKSVAQREKHD